MASLFRVGLHPENLSIDETNKEACGLAPPDEAKAYFDITGLGFPIRFARLSRKTVGPSKLYTGYSFIHKYIHKRFATSISLAVTEKIIFPHPTPPIM